MNFVSVLLFKYSYAADTAFCKPLCLMTGLLVAGWVRTAPCSTLRAIVKSRSLSILDPNFAGHEG
jgi:hypothetical protein